MKGKTCEPMLHPVIVYRISYWNRKMQLVIVISRGLMNFLVGILQTLVEIGADRNFGNDNL